MADDIALFVLPPMPSQTCSAARRKLHAQVVAAVEEGAEVWTTVRMVCYQLYQAVVPRRLDEALKKAAATADGDDVPILRVNASDGIPWELLYDGTDFLGLRFQIARLPLETAGPQMEGEGLRTVNRIYNLLGEHLFEENDASYERWKETFSLLVADEEQEVRCPSSDGANSVYPTNGVLEQAEAPDILHITCHGDQKDKDTGEVFWTLNHQAKVHDAYRIDADYWTTWGQMYQLFDTQPLVFGNACASVRADTDTETAAGALASGDAISPGLGPIFFALGAVAFVGTLLAVSTELSVKFACQFYENLLGQNLPIGKALWKTKKYFDDLGGTDPSWLFYCLYGPPETRFQIAD